MSSQMDEMTRRLGGLSPVAIPPIPANPVLAAGTSAHDEIDEQAPLVILEADRRVVVRPHYYLKSVVGATPVIRVREPVVARLRKAASLIPDGFAIAVLDGWRADATQRAVYERICEAAREAGEQNPSAFAFDLDRRGALMGYPTRDAPHRTGGAVDVALLGPDGRDWEMGTEFDAVSKRSAMRALEQEDSPADLAALIGRRVLYHAMAAAGFTNYPGEWWHFDYGNAFWRYYGRLPSGNVFQTLG